MNTDGIYRHAVDYVYELGVNLPERFRKGDAKKRSLVKLERLSSQLES